MRLHFFVKNEDFIFRKKHDVTWYWREEVFVESGVSVLDRLKTASKHTSHDLEALNGHVHGIGRYGNLSSNENLWELKTRTKRLYLCSTLKVC